MVTGAETSLVTGEETVVTEAETSLVTGAGLETLGTGAGAETSLDTEAETLVMGVEIPGTGEETSVVTSRVGLDSGTGNSRDASEMDPGTIEVSAEVEVDGNNSLKAVDAAVAVAVSRPSPRTGTWSTRS